MIPSQTQAHDCAECARLRGLIKRALATIRRAAGGTVSEVKRILEEAARP